MPKKVALYIRVSTERQAAVDGNSSVSHLIHRPPEETGG
jgi:DNA invertase Pin-like site-specific DNA recombinase